MTPTAPLTPRPAPGHDLAVSRRTLLLGVTAAIAAAQLAACGRAKAPAPDNSGIPALLTARNVARLRPAGDAPVDAVAAGIGAFGHALGRASAATATNWVVSPLSIACAFAMARVGAGGTTASQIDGAFGFPASGRDDAFNAITRQLVTADVPPAPDTATPSPGGPKPRPVVCLGNALFTQQGFPIGAAFLRTLAEQYGAGARPVDFTKPGAANQINDWVRQQTAGRITKLFDSLDAATELVLANTVYLKAAWASYFAEDPVTQEPFARATGGPATVAMMHQTGQVPYAARDGWQAVALPYAGADLAMWLMLPAPGKAPLDLLTPATLSTMGASFATTAVAVSVPRWDFATSLDLGAVLPAMGLTVPFGVGADFSGIHPGLFINQAVHRANITVDEWGTVAAAVTGLAFATSATVAPPLAFQANRPFAFAIVGGPSRVPLFTGLVGDPSAH